jgi:amidase
MPEVTGLSATELARAIRDKRVSSLEVVEAHLKRIEEVNGRLNAVVQLLADSARKAAGNADAAIARGEIIGPLHGVPFTVKDALEVEGVISTGGTKGRASFVPDRDAPVVARLRGAGAILIGKTNVPEISFGLECSNLVYGRTNNPWDLERTPGGSSGGEAAIIAAGGSPLGLGSDAGGSIRWPAHCCGIAGIKPTSGRVPRTGHWPPFGGVFAAVTQIGPMARSVDDLVLTLPILAGMDWVDPTVVPIPLGDPDQVDLKEVRVAFHADNGVATPTPETMDAVRSAAALLEGSVKSIEEGCPRAIEQASQLHMELHGADGGESARGILKSAGTDEMDPFLQKRLELAAPHRMTTTQFLETVVRWEAYRSEMLSFMEDHDVILGPASAHPASLHGRSMDYFPGGFSYSHAYNVAGWPAVVIRGGTSPEGLPIGIQVVSRPWREDLALAVARFLEKALGGWSGSAL